MRAHRAGYATWYDPRLVVKHCAHPERMEIGWFFLSGYRYGQVKARLNFREWHAQDFRPASRQIFSQMKSIIINFSQMFASMVSILFERVHGINIGKFTRLNLFVQELRDFSLSVKLLDLYF